MASTSRSNDQPAESQWDALNDTEDPLVDLDPAEDVYTYFMFITPTEKKKEGSSVTMDTLTAYLLIFLNVFFQGVLLYAVFDRVVLKTSNWRSGITDFGGGGMNPIPQHTFLGAPETSGCNDGSSLCTTDPKTGRMTCAPPSVQLTARWKELDLDGDGFWTREEMMEAREDLKCKYIVDPLEAFEVFRKTVLARDHIIWIHPDLREGRAIHESYFQYAAGDIIMCGYRDPDMCGNLVSRGFFDAALEFNTVPRVGNTTSSAFEYCRNLLTPGGFCEVTLPSTYSVWKIESAQECGGAEYEGTVYKHPTTEKQKSFLLVDYEARLQYERTQMPLFKVFLFIILMLWFMGMMHELKRLITVFAWIRRFPSSSDFPPGEDVVEEKDGGEVKYEIKGISSTHRLHVLILTLVRFAMLAILSVVGASLLLKSPSYMDLIMDAVSLVFVLEIAGIIYAQVLRPQIRAQVEGHKPMTVDMLGWDWLNRRPALLDMVWLVGTMAVVAILMHIHYEDTVEPLYDALKCTCLKVGEKCHEAQAFDYDFWHKYWKVTTPEIFATVNDLRSDLPNEVGAPAPSIPAAPAALAAPAAAAAHLLAEHVPRTLHHVSKHLKKHFKRHGIRHSKRTTRAQHEQNLIRQEAELGVNEDQ